MKFLLLYLSFILFLSCQRITTNQPINYKKVSTLNIPITKNSYLKGNGFRFLFSSEIFKYNNHSVFALFNIIDTTVYLFNLQKGAFEKKIKFPNQISFNKFSKILFHDNSFYIINNSIIYKTDTFGSVIDTFYLNDISSKMGKCRISVFGMNKVFFTGNQSFFSNLSFGYETYLQYYKVDTLDEVLNEKIMYDFPFFGLINFKAGLANNLLYIPNEVNTIGEAIPPELLLLSDTVVVSFSKSNNIYFYKNGKIFKKKELKSKYIKYMRSFDIGKLFDPSYQQKFFINEPAYLFFTYDAKNQLFYRVVKHRIKKDKTEVVMRKFNDADWSVLVTNKDFNKIQEISFDMEKYESFLFAYEGGFIIKRKTQKTDTLKFDVYEVTK